MCRPALWVHVVLAGSIACLATLASLTVASAQGEPQACLAKNGLAYGPFRDGQGPEYALPLFPRTEQIDEDIRFLSNVTKRLRSYSTTSTEASVARIAKAHGVSVAQGIYLGRDEGVNDRQIAAALQLAKAGLVDSLIVGNEVLTSGTVTKARLVEYIRQVKKQAPANVPVTTAEVWNKWIENPEIADVVDFVMAHFYPFWEGSSIDDSSRLLWRNYETLQGALQSRSATKGRRIVIGETGWPSAGASRAKAVPGEANQRRFVEEFLTSACAKNVPFFFFSAFDEEWKWKEGHSNAATDTELPRERTFVGKQVGSSWGLFQSNGRLKSALAGLVPQPPLGTRVERDIFVDGQLSAFYDIGVDSSHKQRNWLTTSNGIMEMAYPARQEWGAVFITVGEPASPPRPSRDFSGFEALTFELRGERGGESVEVGIKDRFDPNDGRETKVRLQHVGREFTSYTIRLTQFASQRLKVPSGLTDLNVVVEFVFTGSKAQTVQVRNLRYVPAR